MDIGLGLGDLEGLLVGTEPEPTPDPRVCGAVLSWLVAFNVINTRSPIVWRTMDFLDRIISPILAPFRAFVPNFGGLDISFILAFLVIRGMQWFLLPAAQHNLHLLLPNL